MEDRRSEGLSDGSIELVAGDARVRLAALGAEPVSWRVGARDLLWTPDVAYWSRTAPILFPCVGWSCGGVIRVDGQLYPMPVHGFAADSHFTLIERTGTSAVLELASGPRTLGHYPFHFVLRALYALEPRALRIELQVMNAGVAPMPYACGLHPGLAWPFAGGAQRDYAIHFEEEETPRVPVIADAGLFSARTRAIALAGSSLPLGPDVFANEALCFLNARSRSLSFAGPAGAITARAEGFRHWALWSRPEAPFLCVEAWTGHGDPEGFGGEFRDKPSMDMLAAGETRAHALTLSVSAA